MAKESRQQARGLVLGASALGNDLLVAGRRGREAGGQIGHQRESQTREAELPRRDDFGHRRHAHQIGTGATQHLDLGRGLVARSQEPGVDAFAERYLELGGARSGQLSEPGVVGLIEIRKAGSPGIRKPADEGVQTGEVEVVGKRDEVAGPVSCGQRSGGVGEHRGPRTEQAGEPDGEGDLMRIEALVAVQTAAVAGYGPSWRRLVHLDRESVAFDGVYLERYELGEGEGLADRRSEVDVDGRARDQDRLRPWPSSEIPGLDRVPELIGKGAHGPYCSDPWWHSKPHPGPRHLGYGRSALNGHQEIPTTWKGRVWDLPVPMVVALRYARSTRRDASVRFLSSVTVWGVALGVAALVLAVAALSGFQATLLEEVLSRSPVLQVVLPPEDEPGAWVEQVAALEGVERVQLLQLGTGWLTTGGRVVACELVAFERVVPRWFPDAAGAAAKGLVLPEVLRLRLGLPVGDGVRVVSPRPTLTPFSRQLPRTRKIEVVGTYDAGRSQDHDARIAIPLAAAEPLLWPGDRRIDIEVPVDRVDTLAIELEALVPPGAEIQTYRELNRALFFALRLEKLLMFAGVFLIVAVASQTLVSSLALIVASKQREIGVLATLGLTPRDLGRAIVMVGLLLTGLGVAVGGAFGSTLAYVLDRFRVVKLPDDVYIVDFVPFLLRPIEDLSLILIATLALAWVAARSAGRRVARLRPAEALRR